TLDRRDMLSRPASSIDVNFKDWRLLGSDHIVIGKVQSTSRDQYLVQVQLVDVLREKQLAGFSYPVHKISMRRLAHQISDVIYEKLTGEKGAFNTRIAYVTSSGGKKPTYQLYVADADGYNAQSIMSSKDPVMSPAWSADGQHLAYVSFEKNRSQIFIQEILTGKRQRISHSKGINGAPAWSPDGRRMAMTLSHEANPDIYIYDMETRRFSQLTTNVAIDTEPNWSPDGSQILFTSDRGGKPQLYQVPVFGGEPRRITYEGDYNARGRYSADGKYIAMVHGRDKRYRIAVLEVETGQISILTDGNLDESPSFAPNGRILLYATARGNTGVLSAVSIDGRSQHRLVSREGDIREPAWSPYNQ
ncbi:MAG: Tol-Pal system beta propeller repeat protein TolB, partial [Gammaproteobacteria bacterium]|nr:Tol-Pal system beta propeller repeat protein TolB [Gammaproteobacteria bacterium]